MTTSCGVGTGAHGRGLFQLGLGDHNIPFPKINKLLSFLWILNGQVEAALSKQGLEHKVSARQPTSPTAKSKEQEALTRYMAAVEEVSAALSGGEEPLVIQDVIGKVWGAWARACVQAK